MGERRQRLVGRVRLFGELGVVSRPHEAPDGGVRGRQARRRHAGIRLGGVIVAEGRRGPVDVAQRGVIVEIGQVPVEPRPVGHHPHRVVVDGHDALVELEHEARPRGVVDQVVEGRDRAAEDGERLHHDRLGRQRRLDLRHGGELAERPEPEVGGRKHGRLRRDRRLRAGGGGVGQQAEGQAMGVHAFERLEVGRVERRALGRDADRHGDGEHRVDGGEVQRRMALDPRGRREAGREPGHQVGQVHREFERASEIGAAGGVPVD